MLDARRLRREDSVQRSMATADQGQLPTAGTRERIHRDVRLLVMRRDGIRCDSCGSAHELQLDHRLPVAYGGTSTPDNLQLLCGPCNRRKGVVIAIAVSGSAQFWGTSTAHVMTSVYVGMTRGRTTNHVYSTPDPVSEIDHHLLPRMIWAADPDRVLTDALARSDREVAAHTRLPVTPTSTPASFPVESRPPDWPRPPAIREVDVQDFGR